MNEITHSIESAGGIVVIKNSDSIYIDINDQTAQMIGWRSKEDCIGKMDYDLPCEAAAFADRFVALDKKVFDFKKTLVALDIQHYKSGWRGLLSNRSLLQNQDGSYAMVAHGIDITNTILYRYYLRLFQLDHKISGTPNKAASYILNSDYCSLSLTIKQEECLFFLIRGKSIKEIASVLKISPRTVEDHVNAIKNKLNCQSKKDVIEKAIDSGFLYYFPDSLQMNYGN